MNINQAMEYQARLEELQESLTSCERRLSEAYDKINELEAELSKCKQQLKNAQEIIKMKNQVIKSLKDTMVEIGMDIKEIEAIEEKAIDEFNEEKKAKNTYDKDKDIHRKRVKGFEKYDYNIDASKDFGRWTRFIKGDFNKK